MYDTRPPSYYEPYLDRFTHFGAEPPLLELGAGHGLLLELARSRGIEACGVELDEERVSRCQSKGLDVIRHDLAQPLPFATNSFGMVYCGQVIEHMPFEAQDVLMREAWRVLRPGGVFEICSPCRHDEAARKQDGHISLLTPSELRAKLEAAGFRYINQDHNYPQHVPEIPRDVFEEIWNRYRPDLLSESANAICIK